MKMTRTVKKEKGAALLISLIVLLALTLMAVSGMQSSIFQERMSSSQREGMDALQLAERALSDVEDRLRSEAGSVDWNAPGFYEMDDPPRSIFALTASRDGCQLLGSDSGVGAWSGDVRGCAWYTVEQLEPVDFEPGQVDGSGVEGEANQARITVLAIGPSGESRRAIEALYFYPSIP